MVDSESVRSGNVLVQSTQPGPQPCLQLTLSPNLSQTRIAMERSENAASGYQPLFSLPTYSLGTRLSIGTYASASPLCTFRMTSHVYHYTYLPAIIVAEGLMLNFACCSNHTQHIAIKSMVCTV